MRVACTDGNREKARTIMTTLCITIRAKTAMIPDSSQTLARTNHLLLVLGPHAASALTACTHQSERCLSGVVDTRHKPAAKRLLVTDKSKAGKLCPGLCGVLHESPVPNKNGGHGVVSIGHPTFMRLCQWLLSLVARSFAAARKKLGSLMLRYAF